MTAAWATCSTLPPKKDASERIEVEICQHNNWATALVSLTILSVTDHYSFNAPSPVVKTKGKPRKMRCETLGKSQ